MPNSPDKQDLLWIRGLSAKGIYAPSLSTRRGSKLAGTFRARFAKSFPSPTGASLSEAACTLEPIRAVQTMC